MSMKNNKWSQWKDVGLRTSSDGRDYLLQMRERYSDGKKVFKNRPLDSTFTHYILFHNKNIFTVLKEMLNLK